MQRAKLHSSKKSVVIPRPSAKCVLVCMGKTPFNIFSKITVGEFIKCTLHNLIYPKCVVVFFFAFCHIERRIIHIFVTIAFQGYGCMVLVGDEAIHD